MTEKNAPVTTARKSPSTRPAHQRLSEGRKDAFVQVLEECGVMVWAARAASPHSKGQKGALSSFRDEMRRDPDFRARVEEAQQVADANLLKTARERAVKGIPRYVVQKGQIVKGPDGEPLIEHHVSDRLLEVMLKSRFPADFVEKRHVEHMGTVNHTANAVAAISLSDLDALSPAQRNELATILRTIQQRRQTLAADDSEVIEADYEMIEDPDEEEELSEAEEIERILS